MKRLLALYMKLKIRIPTIFVCSLLLLATCIIGISFRRYEKINVDKHVTLAEGVTKLMADRFDGEKTAYYVQNGYSSEEYVNIVDYYRTLRECNPDVRYMYVYKLHKDSEDGSVKGLVILDLDEENPAIIGNEKLFEDEFSDDFDKMTVENEAVWHIVESEEKGGSLISYVRPILDADGNYACSACVDFSLNELYGRGIDFIIELLVVIGIIVFFVIATINIVLSKILFMPLERMTKCIESFKFESDEDRVNNFNNILALDINVKNEIDELYEALVMSLHDSAYYMTNLNRAKSEIKEISETANKDSLTGVGSKIAYDEAVRKLQNDIDRGECRKYAIIMIDINNLKYINDTYGHEYGDEYIKGCCSIICDIFKRSPVFRIGGDEFVVIIRDREYSTRSELIDDFEDAFDASYANESAKEYYRYSASYGIAEYDPSSDKKVEEVFKKADKIMYKHKNEFKAAHGSYR